MAENSEAAPLFQTTLYQQPVSSKLQEKIIAASLNWIIEDMLPFSIMDLAAFRHFISTFSPLVRMPCSNTVRGRLVEHSTYLRGLLKDHMDKTLLFGCITFDSWTSSAHKPYLGITIHWLDQDYHPQECVLALAPQPYPHTAPTTAQLI
ncbi:hypothetical protein BGZ79_004812, partial [Entomortierella chlamydospora]